MILADWITLGIAVLVAVLGLVVGFGRGLKFFTGGIFGIIISIVVCYFFAGIVLDWQFVQDLLAKFVTVLTDANNGFCNFLLDIQIPKVIVFVIMFIVVQILRIIIVAIIKNVVEIDNIVFKVINKLLGMALMLAVAFMVALIVFQIISWVGGVTAEQVADAFAGSLLRLDWLFENNPLNMIFKAIGA